MSHRRDSPANLGVSREVLAALRLVAELLLVGIDGFQLSFELRGDVNDERRPHVIVERCVDDFERPVWVEVAQPVNLERVDVVCCSRVPETAEPGEKAGFVTDRRTSVVIGVAALPVWKNHHARPPLANYTREDRKSV